MENSLPCLSSFLSEIYVLIQRHKFSLPSQGAGMICPSKKCPESVRGSFEVRFFGQVFLFVSLSFPRGYDGAGSRIRTDDLLITNQLLYQLSYAGVSKTNLRLAAIVRLLNCIFYLPTPKGCLDKRANHTHSCTGASTCRSP